jgi:hypothetical protein
MKTVPLLRRTPERAKLAELGIGQRGDFEMRLGHHLGRLADTAPPAVAPLPKSA